MTRSPNALARMAVRVSKRALSAYSGKFSRRDFTQHQLLAMLALKLFFKTDYRGIVEILSDSSDLRSILKIDKVPHYTTLQKAHARLLKKGSSTGSLLSLPTSRSDAA